MIQVLYSSERAMVLGALKKVLKESFPVRDTLNSVTLDMFSSSMGDLASECVNLPLGCDEKAVVAENCFFLEKHRGPVKYQKGDSPDAFLDYLVDPDPNIYLYLLVYSNDLDLKGPFFTAFTKAGAKISQVNSFSDQEWLLYIPHYFEKRGIRIEGRAINELFRRVKGDYGLFHSEAQKLVSYAAKSQEISFDDVTSLVSEPLEDDVFKLSNALTRGDLKSAFHLYNDLKTRGAEEVYLLNLLAGQFRFLNQVDYLQKGGHVAGEIAAILHCSLGRANASLGNLRRLKEGAVREGIEQLYEAEKSIMSGKMSGELAFKTFLANWGA